MVPKNQSIKSCGERNFFTIHDPRSQLGNFSYEFCMLSTPNGLNYLMSISILQFDLFQVKLLLQYLTWEVELYHINNNILMVCDVHILWIGFCQPMNNYFIFYR